MTAPGHDDRAVSDPIGLVVDLVATVEHQLTPEQVRTVATTVAGGRAKSRRLAAALAERPGVLADGRSPAPRVVGDLLLALREAGATALSSPCCAGCGKQLRTFQRRGQNWYCAVCEQHTEPCFTCGNSKRLHSRDRAGRPRCRQCPDIDGRDPIAVIHSLIAELDAHADPETIAAAVRTSTPRPAHQQKLAWALETQPSLLTGDGHLAPLRAIPRFIDLLHAAGVGGIVRPACPHCHRVVRSTSPSTECGSAGHASPIPASRNARAAAPSASRSRATSKENRCAPTVSLPTQQTWRPASTAAAGARSATEPRTGRAAPVAHRSQS